MDTLCSVHVGAPAFTDVDCTYTHGWPGWVDLVYLWLL